MAVEAAHGDRKAEPATYATATRVFCPIWRDPWMSIGRDTYIHDMLELCGGHNVFADTADRRYPIVNRFRGPE